MPEFANIPFLAGIPIIKKMTKNFGYVILFGVTFHAKKPMFANSGMRIFQTVNGWTLDYVQTGFASSYIVLDMCFVQTRVASSNIVDM